MNEQDSMPEELSKTRPEQLKWLDGIADRLVERVVGQQPCEDIYGGL